MRERICPQCCGAAETWLPLAGYEDTYKISDYGHVCSVPRVVVHPPYGKRQIIPGRPIWSHVNVQTGYLAVHVRRHGRERTETVHRLVAATFIGPCPPGQQVRHWDDVQTHCHRGNLLYGTSAENKADQRRNRSPG